ncbi:MAG: molybdenum cofactor guanylyltransferase [Acidocella sp. 20-57-95]|nr:MAG: molybdenum cofactor guanylyltransferase [Acidocella sp. 20-57-95]OYV59082.1 MAG: molybdenum cofactor guanylyltransferase [Acidocella sp. 21-58-7]HQT65156.1 molybdenum cofactor guanylyltransferase MobA [Acidocella sp.]HQU04993.1 molybdenum cofactor guanylyltransferase MobA [Acidocella sp.]
MSQIAALILAGGLGTRLAGADKAFVMLNGQPLISHLLTRLTPQVPNIAISANGDATRFDGFGLPVLPDLLAGKGPLAGVAAGLTWAMDIGATALLTVPVDTPFIPDNLAARLTPAPTVACYQGRQHHLVALWPAAVLPMLERFLEPDGQYKVRDFLKLIRARQVNFNAPTDPFLNINTPEDLAAATSHPVI